MHRATAANTSGHITTIDHPDTNDRPSAIVSVTPNWNPDGSGGTYDNHNTLDHPQLNGKPNAAFIVTPNWNGGTGTGVYLNHPIGVYYTGGRWRVFNQDIASMPLGAKFNVRIDRSQWQRGSSATVSFNWMCIDDPNLNGRPEARVFVTANWNPGGVGGRYVSSPLGPRAGFGRGLPRITALARTRSRYATCSSGVMAFRATAESVERTFTQLLLASGVASALLYAAMLVAVPLLWPGYSSAAHTVSELSAIGAPTRAVWVPLGISWSVLYGAFGWGVWRAAAGDRRLRVAGAAIFVAAVFGALWPPMHQREVLAAGSATLTDTLHIAWAVVNGILTVLAMGFACASATFDKRFRLYTIASVVVLLAAGAATSFDAPRLEANQPTPWMGLWERINIGVWLVWVASLSALLASRFGIWRSTVTSP